MITLILNVFSHRDFRLGLRPPLTSKHSTWLSTLSESVFLALSANIFFPGLHFSLHSCYTPGPPPLPHSSLISLFSPKISIIRAGTVYVLCARHQYVCTDEMNSLQSHNSLQEQASGCVTDEDVGTGRLCDMPKVTWLWVTEQWLEPQWSGSMLLSTTSSHDSCVLESSPPDINEDSVLEVRSSREALLMNSSTISLS